MKAIWNGVVLAESSETIELEGNHYFPPGSLKKEYFKSSDTRTSCPWKGMASYYHLAVDGKTNEDAAWYYPEPRERAEYFKGYVAFWRGVEIRD